MAKLSNIESNIQFKICLNKIAEEKEAEYETWIYSELEIKSNVIKCSIGEHNNFMLNKYELDNLSNHLNKLLSNLKKRSEYSFEFSNYECDFEVKMCTVVVDEVIEVEVWINWANYTNGKDIGYDVGMRFVANMEELQLFVNSFNEEMNCLFSD